MAGLLPTAEQDELRAVVRALVADHAGNRRTAIEAGGDDRAWRALVEQVGVAGLVVPEELGGGGFGFGALAVVLEETAGGLLPVPILPTFLATSALLPVAEDPEAARLLASIAAGDLRACPVLPLGADPGPTLTVAGRTVSADRVPVLEAAGADVLVGHADAGEGPALFVVDLVDGDLRLDETEALDLTRPMQLATIEGASARQLGAAGQDLAALHARARYLVAAEQVGGARATLDMAIQWALERRQFDRPIGSFQAIKHQLADAFVNVEAAVAALADATRHVDDGTRTFATAAAVAKSMTGDAFHDNAELNIHVHGGIGFTWEHDAHLFYRRALATNALFGHPRYLDRERGGQLAAPR